MSEQIYYTLCTKRQADGQWTPAFGSYSRDEMHEAFYLSVRLGVETILTASAPQQNAISAVVAQLNKQ